MNQVPDFFPASSDDPITSICVVEDVSKCPTDFAVLSKTYDSELDADLWKETGFFAKKSTRYLCISKTATIADYILENLTIINEKDIPPEGYGLIPRTHDSEQKAWRKKQICYKLSRKSICKYAITDIILLGRAKKAPDGFTLVGDLNGLFLCFKSSNGAHKMELNDIGSSYDKLNGTVITEHIFGKSILPAASTPSRNTPSSSYPRLNEVPFILNSRYDNALKLLSEPLPSVKYKTREDLDREYHYEMVAERQYG